MHTDNGDPQNLHKFKYSLIYIIPNLAKIFSASSTFSIRGGFFVGKQEITGALASAGGRENQAENKLILQAGPGFISKLNQRKYHRDERQKSDLFSPKVIFEFYLI